MKFHTVNTIMNGVKPVEANIGQKVEWHTTLVNLETGEVHREFYASGTLDGFTMQGMPNPINGQIDAWKYAIFVDLVIAGKNVVEAGVPVGFFR